MEFQRPEKAELLLELSAASRQFSDSFRSLTDKCQTVPFRRQIFEYMICCMFRAGSTIRPS